MWRLIQVSRRSPRSKHSERIQITTEISLIISWLRNDYAVTVIWHNHIRFPCSHKNHWKQIAHIECVYNYSTHNETVFVSESRKNIIINLAEICKVHDCRKVISQISDAPRIPLAKPTCNLSLYCESYQIQVAYSCFGIELWLPELFNFRPSWTLTIDNVSRSKYACFVAMSSPRHPCCWVCITGHVFRDGAQPLPEPKLTFS